MKNKYITALIFSVIVLISGISVALMCNADFALSNNAAQTAVSEESADSAQPTEAEATAAPSASTTAQPQASTAVAEPTRAGTSQAQSTRPYITLATEPDRSGTQQEVIDLPNINSAYSTARPVKIGEGFKDALASRSDVKIYTFTADKRGGLSVNFIHEDTTLGAGTAWYIYLFEKYSPNGMEGEMAYRLLTRWSADMKKSLQATSAVGIYPGEYCLAVTSGIDYDTEEYTLKINLDSTSIYEAEPNDTIYRYNEIMLNTPIKGVSSLTQTKDNDWFMFRLTRPMVIDLSFSHGDEKLPQVGWIISLTDEEGNSHYFGKSYFSDLTVSSGQIGLPSGNYFICISSHISNEAQYTLQVTAVEDESFETEYNDTKQSAGSLVFDDKVAVVKGSITERLTGLDNDWFRFSAAEDGVISFSFLHDNYMRNRDGWSITIYDAFDNLIYYTTSQWAQTDVISPLLGVAAGDYYICVSAEDMLYNSGTYTIKLVTVEAERWESERNDSFETADELPLNTEISGTLVNVKLDYDRDCYYVDVDKPCYAYVKFSHANLISSNEGWVISVYKADGSLLESFSSRWVDTERVSSLLSLEKGRYYISIDTGIHFKDKKYTVKVETVE